MIKFRLFAVVGLVLLSVVSASCGFGSKVATTIPRSEVEVKGAATLAGPGVADPRLSCPGDLHIKLGSSEICDMVSNGGSHSQVIAKITSVIGSSANIDYQVKGVAPQ